MKGIWRWSCCQCGDGPSTLFLNTCFECGYHICTSCDLQISNGSESDSLSFMTSATSEDESTPSASTSIDPLDGGAESWAERYRTLEQYDWNHVKRGPAIYPAQFSENKRKVLRILLSNEEHLACPDSGSEKNIMAESFAKEHGFDIRRSIKDTKLFQLGNGQKVFSVGRVFIPVDLPHNSIGRKNRWFHVLPMCPVPLIVGMPFLKEAEILTKHRHLLEDCPDEWRNIYCLLWVGSPQQVLRCILDGHNLTATADTGSDLNFISQECAKREGFQIDRRREARRRIQVGDGTETETIGQVYIFNLSLDWRKPETTSNNDGSLPEREELAKTRDQETPSLGAVFHALPGLPCDLIFGRDLLDQTDTFTLSPDLLVARTTVEDGNLKDIMQRRLLELNILIDLGPLRRRKRQSATADPKDQRTDEYFAEMHRRSKKEDEIAAMPENQQAQAKAVEREKLIAYETLHIACIYCHP